MAKPMTARQFLDALKAEGLKVSERTGWRTHNRNSKGSWGPLHGVMMHHTASASEGIVDYCFSGEPDLPGPLCHAVIEKDGTVHLTGWGRANHAGGGDPEVLAAVIEERTPLPPTQNHNGGMGAVDGNAHFIGFECVNEGNGVDPWPAVQRDAMQRAAAAVCRVYGWSAASVIRHMDWSDRKEDPRGIDWDAFQEAVQRRLDGPGVPHPSVSLAHVREAARRDPAAPQGAASYRPEVVLVEEALMRTGFLSYRWADGSFGTKTVEAYRRLQIHLGYWGQAADGIPGRHSLTWLSLKTQLFRVAA